MDTEISQLPPPEVTDKEIPRDEGQRQQRATRTAELIQANQKFQWMGRGYPNPPIQLEPSTEAT
jgi:hypothetical protein